MIHVLHLPCFPEESKINPDCLNCFVMDDETPDNTAHIILDTPDTERAKTWVKTFLLKNGISDGQMALMRCNINRSHIPAKLEALPSSPGSGYIILGSYYAPKKEFDQEVIAIF